jgi:hypothetical protein
VYGTKRLLFVSEFYFLQVKRGTKRCPLCIFYGMMDIATINALLVWKAKNPQWNRNKRYQRRLFLEELGLSLVSHLLDFHSKTQQCHIFRKSEMLEMEMREIPHLLERSTGRCGIS